MSEMLAHVFKCSSRNVYGVSVDRSGANMPEAPGGSRWEYVKDIQLHPQDQRLAIDSDEAISCLKEQGYYVAGDWYPLL